MRAFWGFAAAVALLTLGSGVTRATDGSIGLYTDLTATERTAIFSLGVPRTLFIVARLDGLTAAGMSGAEFRVEGVPDDWLVFVMPNPAAVVTLGDPFRVANGAHRANLVFGGCTTGTEGRVLLYTAVVVANSVVEPHDLVIEAGDPPTNPAWTTPIVTVCDAPNYSAVPVFGDSFHVQTRSPQDLDYSQLPGYDGVRGVQPVRGLPGDEFHFRVAYSSADALPPAAGSPRVELDANGDGDASDPGEGVFTMSAADLDSTLANGKEYRFDVALGAPPGGRYWYRFSAFDPHGTPIPGAATVWLDSLFVSSDVTRLTVHAEGIRVLPPNPRAGEPATIITKVENQSERRVDGVSVRIEDVYGTTVAEHRLVSMGPRSTTEVAATWTFADVGLQPIVVRVDPANEIPEDDELDNVASHGVYVGGPGTTGALTIGGLPPLVSVPPASPFVLFGNASYPGGNVPFTRVQGGWVAADPSWEEPTATRTDAAGEFSRGFIAPAVPGSYSIVFTVDDGARRDSTTVSVAVSPFGGALPPHGPNLAVQLATTAEASCGEASAPITATVTNRGDRSSEPTTVRILAGGTAPLATLSVAALAPGATVALDPVVAALDAVGVHAFTAHVDPGADQRELREDDNASSASVRVPPACLDLALEAVRFSSNTLCSGQQGRISAHVVNRGCEASLPARVVCNVAGSEIASAPLPGLAHGQSADVLFSPALEEGSTRFDLVIDPEGAAGSDCDIGSNALSASALVPLCGPPPAPAPVDFAVSACDVRVSDPTPSAGQELRFEAWIQNRGFGAAAAPALVRFELDGNPFGDVLQVGPLGSGSRALAVSTASWPADFAVHNVTVIVDPNGQDELTNSNNRASRPLPWDLRVEPIGRCPPSSPAMFSNCSPCARTPITIQALVVNGGLFDCDSVRVEFRDASAGFAVIGSAVARDLGAGGSCPQVPTAVPIEYAFSEFGLHTIQAIVDPNGLWSEIDELNNMYAADVNVPCGAAPDLVAAVRLPPGSIPQPGDTVRAVEVQVTNRGTLAAAAVQARLELDGVLLCNLEMGDLAPNASNTVVCTTPWVAATACSQRLEACADPEGRIGELNEDNNCASSGIAAGQTDLGIYPFTIRATPPNPNVGEQVRFDVGMYSHRGVESTCMLVVGWTVDELSWNLIGVVPLHLPGGVEVLPNVASFVWTVTVPNVLLRFELLDICPMDITASNDVAIGTLPWFIPPNTPVVVSDLAAESTAEGVLVRWRALPVVDTFRVERRVRDADWTRLPGSIPVANQVGAAPYEYLDRAAEGGAQLEYRLVGCRAGSADEILGSVTVLHDALGADRLQLQPVRPNPFRTAGVFEVSLPEARSVELSVYDAAGRRVVQLRSGPQPAGRHVVQWDGRDAVGHQLPAGVYFCRFVSGSFEQTRRFVLVH